MAIGLYSPIISNLSTKNQNNLDDAGLESKLDKLVILIKQALLSEEIFSVAAYNLFSEVFQLRASAIKLIIKRKINLAEVYDSISNEFNKHSAERNAVEEADFLNLESPETISYNASQSQTLNILIQNVLFSLRSLKKVASQLVNENNTSDSFEFLQKISPDTSYEELLSTLKEFPKIFSISLVHH